ncbi:MAG TPA: hypothetical protein VF469_19690, partial [Kofleriaceae bacterium]
RRAGERVGVGSVSRAMLGVQLAVLDYTRRRLARDLAQELDFDAAHRQHLGDPLGPLDGVHARPWSARHRRHPLSPG